MTTGRRFAIACIVSVIACSTPLVGSDNPVPSIIQADPAYVVAGSAGFSLAVTGGSFIPSSSVQWNGVDKATTYVSDSQVVAAIDAADVAAAGSVVVTVTNPLPGGGTSNQASINIASLRTCTTIPIGCPYNASHDLTAAGCDSIHRAGSYAGLFSFEGVAGTSVIIDMTASWDNYLYLLRPDGSIGAENDEGPIAGGSQIATTLDVTGTWTIEATSYHSGTTGTYTLSFAGCGVAAVPQNVVVTYDHDLFATSPGVNVSWQGVAGAADYEADVNGYLLDLGTSGTTSKISGLGEPVCYAIRVRAVDGFGGRSDWSVRDLAVSTIYTEDPLIAGTVPVRAVHFAEIRSAVDLVRHAAGLSDASYSGSAVAGSPFLASDLLETRDALNAALGALGMPSVSFVSPSIDPKIDALRTQMLRDATR